MITRALLILVLLAGPAAAQEWTITIKGKGELPAISQTNPRLPPPPAPPLPPPPVPPPVVDSSPFVFPMAQPPQDTEGSCRYFQPLCAPAAGGCYAALPNCGNPLRASHLFACHLPLGMLFDGTQSIGGMKLYVPAGLDPAQIRTLCAGGKLL